MKTTKLFQPVLLGLLAVFILSDAMAGGINGTNGQAGGTNHPVKPNNLMFMPDAYRKEALRLVLQEANQVAEALRLPEKLPIDETNLLAWHISPPGISRRTKSVGNVTTSNYIYYVSVDGKFSYLEGTHQDIDRQRWFKEYSWPTSLLDTNAAYQLATQWLVAVSMDVGALNKECNLHITHGAIRKQGTNEYFLPVYWVFWTKGAEGHGSAASVELFEPTKTIRQLRVEKSEYILRKPLEITNLDALLSQTNGPQK